ncbi:MAG TPA: glycerol-3-phosphate dehydrogenase, partial [Accumulibacter sp.]|nr:glycerol-3-phosphate dehydrogenase [Accumulibacter sp.]
MRILVAGAGAWGTALAIAFSAQHAVDLWARQPADRDALQNDRENRRFLPGHRFPDGLNIADDFKVSLSAADLL